MKRPSLQEQPEPITTVKVVNNSQERLQKLGTTAHFEGRIQETSP